MVSKLSTYLVSAAIAFVALQIQQISATSLSLDPYTTCTSYDIGDENFPGRGTEIEDDGTCTVTVPEDPNTVTTSRKLEWANGDDIADLEAYFGVPMELKLKNLPTSAVYNPLPWAGSNWPVYLDGNYEWDPGRPSPADKYAAAFGLDMKVHRTLTILDFSSFHKISIAILQFDMSYRSKFKMVGET